MLKLRLGVESRCRSRKFWKDRSWSRSRKFYLQLRSPGLFYTQLSLLHLRKASYADEWNDETSIPGVRNRRSDLCSSRREIPGAALHLLKCIGYNILNGWFMSNIKIILFPFLSPTTFPGVFHCSMVTLVKHKKNYFLISDYGKTTSFHKMVPFTPSFNHSQQTLLFRQQDIILAIATGARHERQAEHLDTKHQHGDYLKRQFQFRKENPLE